ncbi:hypothetical protein SAMN06265222_101234 [Neorhodopirellula lusitana]|uniref:Uncharacterized protein n=1 Tax=Neorhodopirellula lusitana TaxID=445327 RepID=A0ABY1PRP6_9BACT|nr:hypothetical protein [Neorhodopirellula lusitana]SMP39017.1 hypothetical protein SAMN06265222_101234 [Neorhodopirellula lusitana]
MLMRNPDYQIHAALEIEPSHLDERDLQDHTPRESLLGHIVVFMMFLIAILLRSLTS